MWNASRFVMMNMEDGEEPKFLMLTSADKWILSKVNTLAKEVQESLSKYDLGLAAQKVYDFIWDEYCDWYIEMVKPRLNMHKQLLCNEGHEGVHQLQCIDQNLL